mgnify:CR=1 FL=1
MKKTVVLLAMLALVAGFAAAQEEVDLAPGFMPDPYEVVIDAYVGDTTTISPDGMSEIEVFFDSSAPHVVLFWDSEGSGDLYIEFISEGSVDPVLIMVGPDGEEYSNDDYSGLDPAIVIESAPGGEYNIGVGAWSETEILGTLYISELGFSSDMGM